jgi:hypothetical protein
VRPEHMVDDESPLRYLSLSADNQIRQKNNFRFPFYICHLSLGEPIISITPRTIEHFLGH